MHDVWQTRGAPATLDFGWGGAADGTMALNPPSGGSTFRVVDIASIRELDCAASEALFKQMESDHAISGDPGTRGSSHRAETINYGILVRESITLVMNGE